MHVHEKRMPTVELPQTKQCHTAAAEGAKLSTINRNGSKLACLSSQPVDGRVEIPAPPAAVHAAYQNTNPDIQILVQTLTIPVQTSKY